MRRWKWGTTNDTQGGVAWVSIVCAFILTLKNPQDQKTVKEPSVMHTNYKYNSLWYTFIFYQYKKFCRVGLAGEKNQTFPSEADHLMKLKHIKGCTDTWQLNYVNQNTDLYLHNIFF